MRRAVRSHGHCDRGAKGMNSLDGEGMSPNESEPDSASLHQAMMTNLPEMAKSGTYGEVRSERTRGIIRGDRGGRVPKERSRNLRGPMPRQRSGSAAKAGALWPRVAACGKRGESDSAQAPRPEPSGRGEPRRGIHNPTGGGSRNSEQPIAAEKRGNARGARGLYFSRVDTKERRPA